MEIVRLLWSMLTEIVTLMTGFVFLIVVSIYWIVLEFIDGMKGLVKR